MKSAVNARPQTITVVVGMSGGVDSSVAALLLKQQGYRVIGLFLKNWEEDGGPDSNTDGDCAAARDYEDVKAVCSQIDIPCYSINRAKEYWDRVFDDFLEGYRSGVTPNPDVLCNREIKFDVLLEAAKQLGGENALLATGHYARIQQRNGRSILLRGKDPLKDQSYFLHLVGSKALGNVMFPLGEMTKSEIRKVAKASNLKTKEKKESMGICFVGKRDFRTFLGKYIRPKPGFFKSLDGQDIARHEGAHFYTIGQRRGLGIGGPGDRWFVVDKNVQSNEVTVVQGDNHPALFANELETQEPFWITDPPAIPGTFTARIRHRQPEQACELKMSEKSDGLCVAFEKPQRAIAPGQSVVFYDGDECLGGAEIKSRPAPLANYKNKQSSLLTPNLA